MDDLVTVTVMTTLRAEYRFPDMPLTTLKAMVSAMGTDAGTVVVLVNVSGAVLTVPARVVARISTEKEVLYDRAARV